MTKEVKIMSNKQLNLNIKPLVSLLSGLIKCGKNAVYKAKDIAYRSIQSAIHNQSLEAMFKLTGYLSADRMLDHLHQIPLESTQNLIKRYTKKLKLPRKVKLALDFTEKQYYGDKNHIDVIGSKGGKYVRRFLELSCCNPPLFLNAVLVNQFNNKNDALMNKFIDEFYELHSNSEISLFLVDRGFFTKACIKILVKRNIPFIMPAIKNKVIQKLVEAFKEGKIKQKIRYKFGDVEITLAFLKIEDEIYVYATNTKHSPVKICVLYTMRWQIETNFREQNKFLFLTKTTNFEIRFSAFVIAGILFNAWHLTRKRLKHIKESYLYKQVLVEEILKSWQQIAKRRVVKNVDYSLLA